MSTPTKKLDPELEALVRLSDEDIDTSDIPEVTDWSKAIVGKFYRPIKEPVTLRLDADIIAWLKSEGPGYQTRINALLRTAMLRPITGAGTLEGGNAQPDTEEAAEELGSASRSFRFPSLEERQELDNYCQVAVLSGGEVAFSHPRRNGHEDDYILFVQRWNWALLGAGKRLCLPRGLRV